MIKKEPIIAELTDLLQRDVIEADAIKHLIETYSYEPLQHYLNSLFYRVSPETATQELFRRITLDLLGFRAFPEVGVEGGFVDVALRQQRGNPVMVELKPLYELNREKQQIKLTRFSWESHIKQVKKYLLDNEYVILTNLRTMHFFSRDALLLEKPFAEMPFLDFLTDYTGNIWDDVRRLEDQIPKPGLDQRFFEDLKRWYTLLQQVDIQPANGFDKDKLSVLFLNKMIFIRTLEDHGLIPYKFLEDMYRKIELRWYVKGQPKVFTYFFEELEEWFWDYYNAELFKTKFWVEIQF